MISQARVTFIREVAGGFYENALGLSVSMISNTNYMTSKTDITLLFNSGKQSEMLSVPSSLKPSQ